MVLLLIVSILFLVGAVSNLFSNNVPDFIAGVSISAFLIIAYFFARNEKKQSDKFINWLIDNRQDIYTGKAIYNGYRIDMDTMITQYQFCLSCLIISIKIPSRFFLKDDYVSNFIRIIYTLFSLIIGWWGFPWGPIYTIQVLFKNLTGGNKKTLKEVLPDIKLDTISPVFKD